MPANKKTIGFLFIACISLYACQDNPGSEKKIGQELSHEKGTYGYDADFLRKHLPHAVELQTPAGNAKILVSPELQGRVMTSTAVGDSGISYGWINYDLIAANKFKAHFNPAGGEERFWMGPEGGQYSIYFNKGDSFNLGHWQVPPIIDTLPYALVSLSPTSATFSKHGNLVNYSGTAFDFDITRSVELLDNAKLSGKLNIEIPAGISSVAFETDNQIRNTGSNPWKKETGLLSIWLLGMMTPSSQTFVFIPFKPGPQSHDLITSNYFGDIPSDRLAIKDSVLYFKCDGKFRSKIGLSPGIAGSMAASFNFEKNILSMVVFKIDPQAIYVNSKWEIQKFPYKGDVVNSYNDGPLADGTQLGPFYEIESSSAAKELKPGEVQRYTQVTCHFQGDYPILRKMVKDLFSIDLDELKKM